MILRVNCATNTDIKTSWRLTNASRPLTKSFLTIAIATMMIFGAYSTALADVTGFFAVRADIIPQTTSAGASTVQIDFQNELAFTLQVWHFGWNFHGHGGITGLEDIMTSVFFSAGGLHIEPSVVIAQPFQLIYTSTGFPIPVCLPNVLSTGLCELLFVSQRVDTRITFGGITIRNLTIFEDATFPDPTLPKPPGAGYGVQSQSFGFGNVIEIGGQTTGGITVHAATGICAQNTPKKLKKLELPYSLNRDCATGATTALPFFFDFETFSVSGIPITPSVTASAMINCVTIFQCLFSNTIAVLGGPVPLSTTLVIDDLFTLDMQSLAVTLTQGAGSLTVQIGSGGAISMSSINLSFLLNPDTNPGRLSILLKGAPGVGIDELDISFSATRLGLTTVGNATFTGSGGDFELASFSVASSTQIGVVSLQSKGTFSMHGLELLNFKASVQF